MKEDDRNWSISGLFIVDLGATPDWNVLEYDVATDNGIFIGFFLLILRSRSSIRIMKDFQSSPPDMRPMCKARLVTEDLNTFLLDVHPKHA